MLKKNNKQVNRLTKFVERMTQHLDHVVSQIMPMIDCGGIYHDQLYTLLQNNNNNMYLHPIDISSFIFKND